MIIHIDDSMTAARANERFAIRYPYLKLAFFEKRHGQGEISKHADLLPDNTILGNHRKKHAPGELILTPNMTVCDVEDAFELQFGLHVQVMRRQGKVWIVTGTTDIWTLEQQNEEGRILTSKLED